MGDNVCFQGRLDGATGRTELPLMTPKATLCAALRKRLEAQSRGV